MSQMAHGVKINEKKILTFMHTPTAYSICQT